MKHAIFTFGAYFVVGILPALGAQVPRFTSPVAVTELNSARRDAQPWVSPDGLEVYFGSDRDDAPTMQHIYLSTRSSVLEAFSAPVRVVEINHPPRQDAPFVSPDGLTMYFTSRHPLDLSDGVIWEITRNSTSVPWDSSTQ